jgi:uncharacterized protein YerC
MTNVSKKPLRPELRRKLLKQFSAVFETAGEARMSAVFQELFTEAEQIMFVKRLAIIILLSHKLSNYAIANHLDVSEATVRSIKTKYAKGEYETIVRIVGNKRFDTKKFWRALELVLSAGLPPRAGRGRWRFLYQQK